MKTLFQGLTLGFNPIEDPQFFVAEQYLDFLNRTADAKGLEHWTDQIRQCGSDAHCISEQRVAVSAAFFISPEFQRTGYMIYRLYKAAYGRRPSYDQFMADRAQLIEGPQLAANTLEYARRFVLRPEFRQTYPGSLSPGEFVARLYNRAELRGTRTEQSKATAALAGNQQDRAQILLDLIENKSFKAREYNAAFVLMQYFGYLRREPDQRDYDSWLNFLDNKGPENYRPMVCSFINSQEYQKRFSAIVPRSNQACGP
jgi:hypothetical protein